MVTDFEERLRQIREAKARETEQQRLQANELASERHAFLASRFDRREQVEKAIAEFGDKFMDVVPAFQRTKSFFEGMYKIEVSSDEVVVGDGGKVSKLFSRITFLIDTRATDGRIEVRCKKTVRNRDLESTTNTVDVTPDALEAFRKFADEQFIEFAGMYFAGTSSVTAR